MNSDSVVLEIGSGLGNLTRYLAASAGRVIAVELDRKLASIVQEELNDFANLQVVQGDILEVRMEELNLAPGYLVVANIPYYITSAIIRKLLEAPIKPSRIFLTIQREVAERVCALPGDMSLLSLSVQVFGEPKRIFRIPAEAFYPAPKVDSTVLMIQLFPQPLIPEDALNDFFILAKAGFSQKRKTIRNSLAGGLGWQNERVEALLSATQIDARRRAETLTITEWATLTQEYRSARID